MHLESISTESCRLKIPRAPAQKACRTDSRLKTSNMMAGISASEAPLQSPQQLEPAQRLLVEVGTQHDDANFVQLYGFDQVSGARRQADHFQLMVASRRHRPATECKYGCRRLPVTANRFFPGLSVDGIISPNEFNSKRRRTRNRCTIAPGLRPAAAPGLSGG